MKRKMHMIRMAVSGLGIGLNVNHYVNFAGQNSKKIMVIQKVHLLNIIDVQTIWQKLWLSC